MFCLTQNRRSSLIEEVSIERHYKARLYTATVYNSHPEMLCSLTQTRLELFLEIFYSRK